jgi:outer membrane lipoprotein-sorting protein
MEKVTYKPNLKRRFIMKKFFALIMVLIFVLGITGCTQADRVSSNLSQQADNFNVSRKLTVINQRTDTILFQMTGNFSINKASDGDLEVIGENDNGTYYKHFVCLSSEITYVVEDLGTTTVSKHHYEINFNPKMIIPVEPVVID